MFSRRPKILPESLYGLPQRMPRRKEILRVYDATPALPLRGVPAGADLTLERNASHTTVPMDRGRRRQINHFPLEDPFKVRWNLPTSALGLAGDSLSGVECFIFIGCGEIERLDAVNVRLV